MTPTDEIRARLNELGVEYEKPTSGLTVAHIGGVKFRFYEHEGPETNERDKGKVFVVTEWLTPEQAIAATVGNRTDLARRLREVTGLHAFSELFGFNWEDESDWTWHDVACAMADAVDATTEGAGTCDGSFHKPSDLSSGRVPLYYCKNTNRSIFVEREAKACPLCGGRIKEEAE